MSAETETGSDGATTPTNGSTTKTSPAAAYRKSTNGHDLDASCLLYTSPSPRDA